MKMQQQRKLVTLYLAAILLLFIGTYLRLWSLRVPLGPFSLAHWFAIVGAGYIFAMTLFFSYAKRHTALNRAQLLVLHVFGNLTAVAIIALHFAHHISRPAQFYPDLSTGLVSFLYILLIVPAGFFLRFGVMAKQSGSWRIVHVGISIAFLILVLVHTLKNFGFF
jgi:hypothetical protein